MFGFSPNIEGSLVSTGGECLLSEYPEGIEQIGALYCEKSGVGNTGNVYDTDGTWDIRFNASNGNALYSGDKLQAPALQTLCCIKF